MIVTLLMTALGERARVFSGDDHCRKTGTNNDGRDALVFLVLMQPSNYLEWL